jgi:hypothetical protein
METAMKRMIVLLLLWAVTLTACGQSTIGNGQVDPVEEAALQVAVGAALSAYPQAAGPAYRVSYGLLLVLDADSKATPALLDAALAAETSRLHLDRQTAASFAELVQLIRAQVVATLQREQVQPDNRVVVLRQLIEIVNRAAKARIGQEGP